MKSFKSPSKNFQKNGFEKSFTEKYPSPKKKNYYKKSLKKQIKKRTCPYVSKTTHVECGMPLGPYTEFCSFHTINIYNVYIDTSNIKNAGLGLFAGPYGFKKNSIIGKYTFDRMKLSLKTYEKRCDEDDQCSPYILCDDDDDCWDAIDIRSTIMRYINDAHNSKYKNNCNFIGIGDNYYVVSTKNIAPYNEILCDYGDDYW